MKHIILKKHLSFLSVIFLTQATAFANTNDNLPKRYNRDRILLLSDSVQENADVIQQYNTIQYKNTECIDRDHSNKRG